jgi:hypothetical protein
MRTTFLQYAAIAAIGGILALAPVAGPAEQLQDGARAASQLAQYCVPPQEDSDGSRLYCREHG